MLRRNLPKKRIRSLNDFYGQFWSNRASGWERKEKLEKTGEKTEERKRNVRKNQREKSTWRYLEMKDKVMMSMKGTESRKWSQFKSLFLCKCITSVFLSSLPLRNFLSLILLRIKTQIRYHKFYRREEGERGEGERGEREREATLVDDVYLSCRVIKPLTFIQRHEFSSYYRIFNYIRFILSSTSSLPLIFPPSLSLSFFSLSLPLILLPL